MGKKNKALSTSLAVAVILTVSAVAVIVVFLLRRQPAEPPPPPSAVPPDERYEVDVGIVGEFRRDLTAQYGDENIESLLRDATVGYVPGQREIRLALMIRKDEAVSLMKEKLYKGEKVSNILWHILRQCRWEEMLPAILSVMNDEEHTERNRALAASAAAMFAPDKALPAFRNFVTEFEDEQARRRAVLMLGRYGEPDDIELIEPLLQHDSPRTRARAARSLGLLGSNAGLSEALELSRHDDFGVRKYAAEALVYIGTTEAKNRLEEMKADDPIGSVRSHSSEYAIRAELEKLDREEAIARLKGMLEESPRRRWAFMYLIRHFGYDAVDFLKELTEVQDQFGYAARIALIELESDITMLSR